MRKATFRTLLAVLGGVFVGLGIYFLYTLRFRTYLGDEPSSWGASFHAPQEVASILAGGLDRALQVRLKISKVLAKDGFPAAVAPAWLEAAKAAGKVASL